jgi:dihydrofolate reductase
MRPQGAVFIATSLDGFIARPDGSIDWLEAANRRVPPGEDCGYGAFIAGIDALVMGRGSFETVLGFDPWPYGALPVVVLSRRPLDVPAHLASTVTVSADAPARLMDRLGAAGHRTVYVDGGQVVQSFLRADLIDMLTLTTVPVLLGSGRRLFGEVDADIEFRLLDVRRWDFGFVQARYERVRRAGAAAAADVDASSTGACA